MRILQKYDCGNLFEINKFSDALCTVCSKADTECFHKKCTISNTQIKYNTLLSKHLRIIAIAFFISAFFSLNLLKAQEFDLGDSVKIISNDSMIYIQQKNQKIIVNNDTTNTQKPDTTKIRFGNKSISIIKIDGETYIKVIELKDEKNKNFDFEMDDDNAKISKKSEKKKKEDKFKGHFAGFEIGLNNYGTDYFSTSLNNESDFMELNTGKSLNFNLNIIEYSFGITHNAGFVTGLGFEFNNYRFDKPYNLGYNEARYIVPDTLSNIIYDKNKLSTTYLTVPLLFEFQIPMGPKEKNKLFFSAGLIGGLKIGSHTRITSKDNDLKTKDDYNLSPFRYGITARAGYKMINIFAIQYLTPFFEKNKGPYLLPFSVGLVLTSF